MGARPPTTRASTATTRQRWLDAYGALPDEPGLGLRTIRRPPRQPEHEWALALADRAIAEARSARRRAIAVAIVDRRGDPIQQDCMDGAPTAGPFVAEAVAAGAATFQLPSGEVPERRRAAAPVPRRVRPRRAAGRRGRARRGRARRRRRADPDALPRDRGGGARVRVCVVGCGAIGGLLRRAARAPSAEVWAYDVSAEHVDAINRDGLRVGRRRSSRIAAPAPTRARSRRASSASSRRRRRSPRRRSPPPRTCSPTAPSAACRTGSAARRSIARHVAAGDPRRDAGRRPRRRARRRAHGRARHDVDRPVRAAARARRTRSTRSPARSGAVALDDARGAQWTKLLFNAATNPLAALTGLTHGELCDAAGAARARRPRWSTRAARSPTRSASRSTATPTR